MAALVLVPMAMYVAAYASFWVQHGPDVPAFARLQVRMLEHQAGHHDPQPEDSSALTWPILAHPIRYWPPPSARGGLHQPGQIDAVGNPALWFGFLALVPPLAWSLLRRRRWSDGP